MIKTELRSFHAVAECGGYIAASKVLNVGQPTLTTQIKTLEARYEVELFHRVGRRSVLTQAGQELYELTSKIAVYEREIENLLQSYQELTTGQLRIAAVESFHVVDIISIFKKQYPNVETTITLCNSFECMDKLLHAEVDVAIFAWAEDNEKVVLEPYKDHTLVAVVNKDHPFYSKDSLSIQDIKGEKFVLREKGSITRDAFEGQLKQSGVTIDTALEIGSREGVRQSVKQGLGIGVVSEDEFIADTDLKAIPFNDVHIQTHYFIAYLKYRQNTRMIKAFQQAAKKAKV